MRKMLAILLMLALLAACGGGGGRSALPEISNGNTDSTMPSVPGVWNNVASSVNQLDTETIRIEVTNNSAFTVEAHVSFNFRTGEMYDGQLVVYTLDFVFVLGPGESETRDVEDPTSPAFGWWPQGEREGTFIAAAWQS